jgi:hypothetical protein
LLRIEFSKLKDVDEEGAQLLLDALKAFGKARRELVLSNHNTLLELLAAKTELGNKDNPQVFWMLLLALYQVLGLQTEFDDVALNFAITYELSPPAFEEPAKAAIDRGRGCRCRAGRHDDDAIVRWPASCAAATTTNWREFAKSCGRRATTSCHRHGAREARRCRSGESELLARRSRRLRPPASRCKSGSQTNSSAPCSRCSVLRATLKHDPAPLTASLAGPGLE